MVERWKRVLHRTLKGYIEDSLYLHAAALTFFCMLSIVPIFAVILGIARGFGYDQTLESSLVQALPAHQSILELSLNFANTLLSQVEGGTLVGIGAIALFWIVVSLLWSVEHSFNVIWKIPSSRSFVRRITDYLAIVLLCPILFVLAISSTVIITTRFENFLVTQGLFNWFQPAIYLTHQAFPYFMIWLVFFFLYLIMPNTKVPFKDAAIAAIAAGSVYQGIQWIFIHFQIGVSEYNAIYGSFAVLPLFLLWMQIGWLIVLIGAELAFHSAQIPKIIEGKRLMISKPTLALWLIKEINEAFERGTPSPSVESLASKVNLSLGALKEMTEALTKKGLLVQVGTHSKETKYQLNTNPSLISYRTLEDAVSEKRINYSVLSSESIEACHRAFADYEERQSVKACFIVD